MRCSIPTSTLHAIYMSLCTTLEVLGSTFLCPCVPFKKTAILHLCCNKILPEDETHNMVKSVRRGTTTVHWFVTNYSLRRPAEIVGSAACLQPFLSSELYLNNLRQSHGLYAAPCLMYCFPAPYFCHALPTAPVNYISKPQIVELFNLTFSRR